MRDDPEQERIRRIAEEEARRSAEEARARADDERSKAEAMAADALTGEMKDEMIRQQSVIYGGLILIGVYMVQPFLVAPSLISEEAVAHVPGPEVRFERVGPARLKGVAEALVIYRARAAKSDSHAPGGNGRR